MARDQIWREASYSGPGLGGGERGTERETQRHAAPPEPRERAPLSIRRLRTLTRLTPLLLPPLPQHPPKSSKADSPRLVLLKSPAGATAHLALPARGSRPPGPPRPPTGFRVPRPAPAAPPPGHTALPAADAVFAWGSLGQLSSFPQPSERGVDAPLTPGRQLVCPSASP